MRSGGDGFDVGEFAVFDGEDGGGFAGVAVGVHVDAAGDAVEGLGGGEGGAEGGGFGRAGAADGVHEEVGGVVAEGGHAVGGASVEAVAVFFDERLDLGVGGFGGVVGGVVATLEGGAGDFEEFGGFPAVAADEGGGDAEFAGLFGDEGDLGVVGGDEDDVGGGGFDGGELGFEVFVALGEFGGGDNFAAAAEGEAGGEDLAESGAVGGGN